jgi:hypothetical protein
LTESHEFDKFLPVLTIVPVKKRKKKEPTSASAFPVKKSNVRRLPRRRSTTVHTIKKKRRKKIVNRLTPRKRQSSQGKRKNRDVQNLNQRRSAGH